MIELHITKTCKFTARHNWQRFDIARERFSDIASAKAWLKTEYGTSKRAPMYRESDGKPDIQCGYVIGFRCKYRSKGDAMWEQHWIEFRECNAVDLKK